MNSTQVRVIDIFGRQLVVPLDTSCDCVLKTKVYKRSGDLVAELRVEVMLMHPIFPEKQKVFEYTLYEWCTEYDLFCERVIDLVPHNERALHQYVSVKLLSTINTHTLVRLLFDDFVSGGVMCRNGMVFRCLDKDIFQ